MSLLQNLESDLRDLQKELKQKEAELAQLNEVSADPNDKATSNQIRGEVTASLGMLGRKRTRTLNLIQILRTRNAQHILCSDCETKVSDRRVREQLTQRCVHCKAAEEHRQSATRSGIQRHAYA